MTNLSAVSAETQKQLALEATYELEALLVLLQSVVSKELSTSNEDPAALYGMRGLIHRADALNKLLMDYVGDELVGDFESQIRGYVPDTLRLAGAH